MQKPRNFGEIMLACTFLYISVQKSITFVQICAIIKIRRGENPLIIKEGD